jgi:DNA polymerase-3 subunit gamma/tau
MSLYQKYRPATLTEIKGNADVVTALTTMLENKETCPHVFLLHGSTGCGKTTLARIIANELGCYMDSADYTEVNTADNRGIDTIRDIISKTQYRPIEGDCRVWVIDECHKMTGDAQNALLKILEDTPEHIYFILCTTDPNKVIGTIKGRCQQFQVKPLPETQMYGLLRKIVRAEGENIEKEVYDQIISDSLGFPRNAIQILEQVLSVPEDRRLEIAQQTALEVSESIALCRALLEQNVSWKKISTILTGLKEQEPEGIRRAVLGYASNTLLKSDNVLCGLILEEFINPFYDSGFPQLVLACYSIIKNK